MTRKWRTPRPWLLLRPGAGDGAWDWLLVERGVPTQQGQGQPPMGGQARVGLIIPAQACSHFQLSAPPGLKREEWPLLLEDRLLQPAHEVLCACVERQPGQLRLVVVERMQLAGWYQRCADWGLPVERCWAQLQLLAPPAAGCAWHWQPDDDLALFKGVGEDGQEHWLAWPTVLGAVPGSPWSQLSVATQNGRWPEQLAALDRLPGVGQAPRVRAPLSLPRGQLRLAALCLALATAWAGLWLSQQWRQAQLYRQQVFAITGEQPGVRQAGIALRRLREADGERQVRLRKLEGLQSQLQAWLAGHPGWRLQAVRFDGQRWHLSLQGDGAAPPWQEMAATAGAHVEVSDGAQVVFDLGALS